MKIPAAQMMLDLPSGLRSFCAGSFDKFVWAAQRDGRALRLAPSMFVSVMALVWVFDMAAVSIPFVEPGIVAPVLALED